MAAMTSSLSIVAVAVGVVRVNQGIPGDHRFYGYGGGSSNRKVIVSVSVELSYPRERIFGPRFSGAVTV